MFRADGVGFRFLQRLALIVAANRHRKRKPDDQRQKGQGRGLYDVEIVTLALFEGTCVLTDEITRKGRDNLRGQGDHEEGKWVLESRGHLEGCDGKKGDRMFPRVAPPPLT